MTHHYTEQQLRDAIAQSRSVRQALLHLGIAGKGGNYRVIHRAIKRYDIDISHFTGQGWAKGKQIGPAVPIEEYLVKGSSVGSYHLKLRLLKEHVLSPVCGSCSLSTWLDKPIPLELDHINGDASDNRLSNLRLLCPNCHAFTDTYRGKNRKKRHA